jgi:hypothetical protein
MLSMRVWLLLRRAEIRFDRAAGLDDHGISAAILRRGNLNPHPTLVHVVFVNIVLLDAIEANTHIATEDLFVVEGAAWIDGEVIRRDVCGLVFGHDGFR